MIKHSPAGRESKGREDSSVVSLPAPEPGLEEAAAGQAGVWGPAMGFALQRLAEAAAGAGAGPPRPTLVVAAPHWLRERGRPFGPGMARLGIGPGGWLLAVAESEAQRLWAAEEALKSGAVAGVLAAVDGASLTATRRLDLSARAGRALGVVLRTGPPQDLSAARVRWRVGPAPSAGDPLDPAAPGAVRWRVEATRRRDGPPGEWLVELDDETPGLRVVPGLADHPPLRRAGVAAA